MSGPNASITTRPKILMADASPAHLVVHKPIVEMDVEPLEAES